MNTTGRIRYMMEEAKVDFILTAWYHQYHFDPQAVQKEPMPRLRKELLSIRGIGTETADVILVYSFYKASFIIDAYTRRFLFRPGYDFS